MIKGTKSNSYGDKTILGFICRSCYRKRVRRRSKILLGFSIGLFLMSAISFVFSIFVYLFVTDLLEEQYFSTIEIFLQLGIIFTGFALLMFYIRYRELTKMREKIRTRLS